MDKKKTTKVPNKEKKEVPKRKIEDSEEKEKE